MDHVIWLGGSPGSGKSTVADRLARRYGLRRYAADTRTWEHRDRAIARGDEAALAWEAMTPEQRWERSPGELLELSLHRQRGPMVLDDVAALPRSPLVVAEGTTVPAGLVDPARALWLLPTPAFEDRQLAERGFTGGVMAHHRHLADVIRAEASEHGLPTLEVDGTEGVDGVVAAVERHLAGVLAAGPVASSTAERRALLREANEAIVAQVRAYHTRPWAPGDAEPVGQTFACECGDPACTDDVEATVGDAAAGPLLAPAHRAETA